MMSSGEPASSGDSSRPFYRRGLSSSSINVEAILIIVVGLTLGLVDQQASEVPGTLRFPALIAALILVGQGINQLGATSEKRATAGAPQTVPVGVQSGAAPVNRGVDPDADDEAGSSTGARLVLILAIWLGIASLVYPSGSFLTLLSLLAAFLLFARAWKVVSPTRD